MVSGISRDRRPRLEMLNVCCSDAIYSFPAFPWERWNKHQLLMYSHHAVLNHCDDDVELSVVGTARRRRRDLGKSHTVQAAYKADWVRSILNISVERLS